jgi:hypothetical protein
VAVVDSYEKTDIQGQTCLFELHFVQGKWEVWCWNVEHAFDPPKPGQQPQYASIEHRWDVSGKTVGYKDGDPDFPIREPFTEETARAEFERWRK